MGRAPCCEKVGLNRGPWTREEDLKLTEYITKHGEGCWRTLPKSAGLLRCGKSCRLRWINYLRPDLKRGNISEDEDQLIITLHKLLGNRWSLIAGRLPGRTDNEIKNYWNTHLKKKLRGMGIDPHTHKPLAQQQELQRYDYGHENASKDSYHENTQILMSSRSRLLHSSSTNDLLKPLKSLVTSFNNKGVEPSVGARSTQASDMMALAYHKSADMLSIDSFLEDSVIDQGVHSEVLPELQDYCQSVGPICVNGSDGKLLLKKSLSSNIENSLSMLSPCSPVSILPQCTFGCTTDIETGSLCTHLVSGHDLISYSDLGVENGLQSKQVALGTFGESPSITSTESIASCAFLQTDVGGTGMTPSSYDSAADMEWERCRSKDTEVRTPTTTTMVAKKQSHSSIEQLSSFLLDDSITTEEVPERKFQEGSPDHSSSTTTDNALLNMLSHDSDVSFWDMEIVQPLSHSCSLHTPDLVEDPTALISMESLTSAMSMSSCNTSSNCNKKWEGTSTGFGHSTEVSALPTLIF